MKPPIVIIGIGELAGQFAQGFLRLGHPVYPVTRESDPSTVASRVTGPALALVAVRESDLDEVLGQLPAPWRSALVLIQNDLVPGDWERHHLSPTVVVVWFEKKPGRPVKVIRPSITAGGGAALVVGALAALDIPAIEVDDDALVDALVVKNLYIGVSNIAGLALPEGTTVGSLSSDHAELAAAVADEILDIQAALVSQPLDRGSLLKDMIASFEADPGHVALGRSAPQRLSRALDLAREHGLQTPALEDISKAS